MFAAIVLISSVPVMADAATRGRVGISASAYADRSAAEALDHSKHTGNVHIFITGSGIVEVRFFLDDPGGAGAPYNIERVAPFDFAGTTPGGTAKPFATDRISNGSHTILAVITRKDGSHRSRLSTFETSNPSSAPLATAATPTPTEAAPPMSTAPPPGAGPRTEAATTPARPLTTVLSGLSWRSGATNAGDSFASWRGRPFDVAVTFEDDGTWKGTEVVWALETGELTGFKGKLAIGIPMLSNRNDTFQRCIAGDYDSHFHALGQTLKDHGREDSYIRLGWEGNGNWYAWSAGSNAAAWKACFRREVQALRSVAPNVQIDWSMNKEGSTSAVDMYPGDDVVDVIGVDYYSMYPGLKAQADWDRMYTKVQYNNSPVGIGAWLAFAKSHGKKLSVPEWGVNNGGGGGGGDDAMYIHNMYSFFKANADHIAYEAYFNSQCPNFCVFPAGRNPQAAARYQQLWSAGK
jgi:hypothetical protein